MGPKKKQITSSSEHVDGAKDKAVEERDNIPWNSEKCLALAKQVLANGAYSHGPRSAGAVEAWNKVNDNIFKERCFQDCKEAYEKGAYRKIREKFQKIFTAATDKKSHGNTSTEAGDLDELSEIIKKITEQKEEALAKAELVTAKAAFLDRASESILSVGPDGILCNQDDKKVVQLLAANTRNAGVVKLPGNTTVSLNETRGRIPKSKSESIETMMMTQLMEMQRSQKGRGVNIEEQILLDMKKMYANKSAEELAKVILYRNLVILEIYVLYPRAASTLKSLKSKVMLMREFLSDFRVLLML
jgi:hypothetical protein